jgi:hypothetical protein
MALPCDYFDLTGLQNTKNGCQWSPIIQDLPRTHIAPTAISGVPPVIKPIIFVPNNLSLDLDYVAEVANVLPVIRAWYAGQLQAKQFDYVPVQVVYGRYPVQHYCPDTISTTQCVKSPGNYGDPNNVFNVLTDLAGMGYPVKDNTILLVFWVSGYGHATGGKYSSTSGYAAVGDWALDGIAGRYEQGTASSRCYDSPYAATFCTKPAQIGTITHELGHAFGLPHPSDDGTTSVDPNYWYRSVMQSFWEFPTAILTNTFVNPEKSALLNNSFFKSPNSDKHVVPILFIPRDLRPDTDYILAINHALGELSMWFADKLAGKTFRYADPILVVGSYPLQSYCPGTSSSTQCIKIAGQVGPEPSDIASVKSDLATQGFAIPNDAIFLIFWVGGYGYADGSAHSPTSGVAVFGDWALDGIAGKYEAGKATSHCYDSQFANYYCHQNAQIGAIGDVLGLTFGLHPSVDDGTTPNDPKFWYRSIMASWWDFPNTLLLESSPNPEKSTLLQHTFFVYSTYIPLIYR